MLYRLIPEIWISTTISTTITGGFVQLWNNIENNKECKGKEKFNLAIRGFRDGMIFGSILGITSPLLVPSLSIYKINHYIKKLF